MDTRPHAECSNPSEKRPCVRCHSCSGFGFTRYHKGRPVPCLKCRGTGWIGEPPMTYAEYLHQRDEPPAAPPIPDLLP